MHLLNARSRSLEYFVGSDIPPYAILSHTWGKDEVSMQDLLKPDVHLKEGYVKIVFTCAQALADGLDYAWVDTCCIDKTSSAELSEAINSMYNWYRRAVICYAYLHDVTVDSDQVVPNESYARKRKRSQEDDAGRDDRESATDSVPHPLGLDCQDRCEPLAQEAHPSQERVTPLTSSRWFTRGWTLQELIAPRDIFFFGLGWKFIGRRNGDLLASLSERSGIPQAVLRHKRPVKSYSVAQRMSWAALRQTSRKEDEAYCLLGIFEVNMPLLYGEEEKAFRRLQEEIIKSHTDSSIFAWRQRDFASHIPLLAPSPRHFEDCGDIVPWYGPGASQEFHLTNSGLSITLPVIEAKSSWVGVLQCHKKGICIGLWLSRRGVLHLDSGGKDPNFFCLGKDDKRSTKVDIQDAISAEKRSIVIQTEDVFDTYKREISNVQSQLWLRLRNHHMYKDYFVQELWPSKYWAEPEEPDFGYQPGSYNSYFTARFTGRAGLSLEANDGVIILVSRPSSLEERKQMPHTVAICFRATRPGVLLVIENGNQTSEGYWQALQHHVSSRDDLFGQKKYIDNFVFDKDLGDLARLHIVLRPESIFAPFDLVLEVTIASR